MPDTSFMNVALGLARRHLGQTGPNPSVGCVLVKDGRVIARAVTALGGRPHAEFQALAMAGKAAKGATIYVTLEPCAHEGSTPSCARLIAEAGITKTVIAAPDPDLRTSGKGVEILKQHGIAVTILPPSPEITRLNHGFCKFQTEQLPMLTLKLALSMDGKIATAAGESKWITGAAARRQVHLLRAQHDAILIGAGTARADDPMLNIREIGIAHQPLRVVIDPTLSLNPNSKLITTAPQHPTLLIHSASSAANASEFAKNKVELLELPDQEGVIDLHNILRSLGARGIRRVFCEGGAMLAAHLLTSNLVDELIIFQAGKILGDDARGGIGPLAFAKLDEAPQSRLIEQRIIGDDMMSRWWMHKLSPLPK